MKILGTLALLWLITFAKANEDQSDNFNKEVNEESSAAQYSSSSSTSSSSSFQERKSLSQEQETYSRTSSQTATSKHETDNKTKVVKENNTRQPGQPESVWIGATPDSKAYDIVEVDNKSVNSRTSSQTVTSRHETDNKKKVVKKNNIRQPGQPESVWIGDAPNSKAYNIVEVDNKSVNSRTSSQTATSKHETDNKKKVVKKNNIRQPGQPESVWIGDTPNSKAYDIVEVDNKSVNSRTSSQTVTSKYETDNKSKVVKENNTRQPGQPESVLIGNTPDSKAYDIVEVHNKSVNSRTSSQTVTSKHDTDNKTKVVKENNTRQPGQPESVWIGNTPDSKAYDIVEVDNKYVNSRISSQTVTSKHETDNKKKIVKKNIIRKPGQPESVWIGDTPDSKAYDIVEVGNKYVNSRTSSQTVTSKHETDNKTKVVKENNTRQPGQPESVWIGATPDSKAYDIVEVDNKSVNSRTSSQTVTSKHETDNKKKVVKKNNIRQPGQPESVWIGDTPNSKAYDIVEVDNKSVNSRTSSQTVTSKNETDNKSKVVKENNTRQPGQPESVWIGNTPDSKAYDIVEVHNKSVNSRTSSQTVTSKHETDNKKKVVKKNIIRKPGQPESVWIGDTPDSKAYDIVEVGNKYVNSRTSSQTVTSKHETDNKSKVVQENNTRQPGRPESVWIGDTPDSKAYDIVEVDSKKVNSRTSSQTVTSKHETDNKTKVVKEKNTRQPGRPESVWIGDTPDSKAYNIVKVDNKNVNSRTSSQTVTSKHETDNETKVVKEKSTRQPGRPESVWIGDTPDSKVYDIVEVDEKKINSEALLKSVTSEKEIDQTSKKTNTRQSGQPESVWVGDIPDPNEYDEIFDVSKTDKTTTSPPTQSYPDGPLPLGYKPLISPNPDQPPNPGPGPIIHATPGQPPMSIPYPPTQTNPPGPKTPIQPKPDQSLNPGPEPTNQPIPAQPMPIPYPPTHINPPGPKPPIQLNPDQPPNPGPGPIIHPTPAQPPVPVSKSPTQPNPVKHKCRRPRKPERQQSEPGYDEPVKPPISVWFGETPDPKDYTIYYINKDTENDECDDYDESSEDDTSVTETDASVKETDTSVTETDTSVTETDKYVKALRFQLSLNTVFGIGKNGECHCTCSSTKPPYFISIPRDKIKGYLD